MCNHAYPFTSELFGDDVSKSAKDIEECNKMGNRMQYGPQSQRVRGRVMVRGRFVNRGYHRGPYARTLQNQAPFGRGSKNWTRGRQLGTPRQ